jgi:Flp pilus assembly protein TadG
MTTRVRRPAAMTLRRADGGMVTAEMAVVLPALVVVLVFALWSVAAVTAQLRCVDAAHTAARALARGEASDASVAAARAAAPAGAQVVVSRSGDLVVVDVRAIARLPGPWSGALPGLALSGRAVAPVEGASVQGDDGLSGVP